MGRYVHMTQPMLIRAADLIRSSARTVEGVCIYNDGLSDEAVLAKLNDTMVSGETPFTMNHIRHLRRNLMGDVVRSARGDDGRIAALEAKLEEQAAVISSLAMWAGQRKFNPFTLNDWKDALKAAIKRKSSP